MRFVEDKYPNFENIKSLLGASSEANQWTNFGPVSLLLEERLDRLWNTTKVVMCSSGTSALFALVNMHSYLLGRKLKWVVSSFSFPCCKQGPLADATVVDCDREGMFDLTQLPDQFDGIVVTNLFGIDRDLSQYKALRDSGKIVIIDSATSFHSCHGFDEIVSFHQTKPWGFGEGGCAVVKPEYERTFRSVINFGLLPDQNTSSWSGNYKISDPAAAFIYDRLDQYDPSAYSRQRERVERIAGELGVDVMRYSTCGHVPILFSDNVNKVEYAQKYYKPLAPTKMAADLYSRILNFPCHPQVSELSDLYITEFLEWLK